MVTNDADNTGKRARDHCSCSSGNDRNCTYFQVCQAPPTPCCTADITGISRAFECFLPCEFPRAIAIVGSFQMAVPYMVCSSLCKPRRFAME